MKHCSAVSDVVGSLIMVSIVTIALGIIAVAILSQPAPPDIPAVDVVAYTSGNTLFLIHSGGDTLPAGDYRILINSVDRTDDFRDLSGSSAQDIAFSTGTELNYSSIGEIRSVQLIYQGDRVPEGVQLFQKYFP